MFSGLRELGGYLSNAMQRRLHSIYLILKIIGNLKACIQQFGDRRAHFVGCGCLSDCLRQMFIMAITVYTFVLSCAISDIFSHSCILFIPSTMILWWCSFGIKRLKSDSTKCFFWVVQKIWFTFSKASLGDFNICWFLKKLSVNTQIQNSSSIYYCRISLKDSWEEKENIESTTYHALC